MPEIVNVAISWDGGAQAQALQASNNEHVGNPLAPGQGQGSSAPATTSRPEGEAQSHAPNTTNSTTTATLVHKPASQYYQAMGRGAVLPTRLNNYHGPEPRRPPSKQVPMKRKKTIAHAKQLPTKKNRGSGIGTLNHVLLATKPTSAKGKGRGKSPFKLPLRKNAGAGPTKKQGTKKRKQDDAGINDGSAGINQVASKVRGESRKLSGGKEATEGGGDGTAREDVRDFPDMMREISKAKRLELSTSGTKQSSEIAISTERGYNKMGRPLCKVVGCTFLKQSWSDGFCGMHFNMCSDKAVSVVNVEGRNESGGVPPASAAGAKPNRPQSTRSSLEKVVGGVADAVADEIRHCASVFSRRRPKVVVGDSEDLPHKRTIEESSGQIEPGGALSTPTVGFQKRGRVYQQNAVASDVGFSVVVSEEGTVSRAKHTSVALDPPMAGTSAKPETHLPDDRDDPEVFDARSVIEAVRRFALEVYCPYLVSAKKRIGTKSLNSGRIRISVLLAIREMLILNGDKLFNFTSLKGASVGSAKERTYLSHVFANAIIRNAVKRLPRSEGILYADFIQAAQSYDTQSDVFRFSLAPEDVRSVYTHPDGTKVGPAEASLAKVGFNYARAMHPLLGSTQMSLEDDTGAEKVGLNNDKPPARLVPTACAVFRVEEANNPEPKDDSEAKILESLKEVLKRKRAARGAEEQIMRRG